MSWCLSQGKEALQSRSTRTYGTHLMGKSLEGLEAQLSRCSALGKECLQEQKTKCHSVQVKRRGPARPLSWSQECSNQSRDALYIPGTMAHGARIRGKEPSESRGSGSMALCSEERCPQTAQVQAPEHHIQVKRLCKSCDCSKKLQPVCPMESPEDTVTFPGRFLWSVLAGPWTGKDVVIRSLLG